MALKLAKTQERAQSLGEEIAAALEHAIITGRLRPRSRLIELDLAAEYQVSRAPVREALRLLERDGLVAKSSQGFEVADMAPEEAADMFEILAHLEELFTRRAAPHIDRARLARMSGILRAMETAVRREDLAAYYAENLKFHAVIHEACPSRPLTDLLDSLGKRTLRFRHLAMSMPGRLPASLEEHRRVLAALKSGDAAAAGRHARESAEHAFVAIAAALKNWSSIL
jgi:DNA-binding GntR family transcriptional regulator